MGTSRGTDRREERRKLRRIIEMVMRWQRGRGMKLTEGVLDGRMRKE